MSKKSKNPLVSGNSVAPLGTAQKLDLLAKRYSMDSPGNGVYPLSSSVEPLVYPDFEPFREGDTDNDKLSNSSVLNKGLFESPQVSNEYFSARNLIQETIFSSSQSCTKILGELSSHLAKAYKSRNEVINQISSASNHFKLAPRVTLIALKKEAWLRDLANPDVPLHTISHRLPHGIRNKVLIDCLCTMNVPISRAIWFTKCVLYSEQMLLRKKIQARTSSGPCTSPITTSPRTLEDVSSVLDTVEARWLQEWTSQIADYVLKLSKEMPSINTSERSAAYKKKLNYLFKLVQTFYVEFLLDRLTFLLTIIGFLREDFPLQIEDFPVLLEISNTEVGESCPALDDLLQRKPLNFGQTLVALTFVKIFWKDIIKEEFLTKRVCESLLLNYFVLERVSTYKSPDDHSSLKPTTEPADDESPPLRFILLASLKNDLLGLISRSIVELFLLNNNLFILPDYWILIGNVLYRILISLQSLAKLAKDSKSIESTLQLIHFRNESLMLNMKHSYKQQPGHESKARRRSSFLKNNSKPDKFALIISQMSDSELSSFNRPSDDNLRFIDLLDKLKLNNSLAILLIPTSSSAAWKVKVKILIFWCVTIYRDMGDSSERIHILCNFIKRKILQRLTTRSPASIKTEFENEILESIFSLAYEPSQTICMHNLFVLFNQLYQLKIVSMASYLRKVIACGIFYLSASLETPTEQKDPQVDFHLTLLLNLPAFTDKQYFHIVKKWTNNITKFSDSFEWGIQLTRVHILDSLSSGIFRDDFNKFLDDIKAMNTGVKFLIVNWLTPQIIATISNSPKLIHIFPFTIGNIYSFYSCTDNLSTFFKVFIKVILKNENKVLIYYLDTLFYISKLSCFHYNLLKIIAGNNHDSVSMAYEIFKLIVMNYIDISSRETNIFNFKEIWNFIDKSVEKSVEEDGSNQKTTGFKKLFNKDIAESPLKIQTQSPKNDSFSVEMFVTELNKLILEEPQLLSKEDISELLVECHLSESDLNLKNLAPADTLNISIANVLRKWYNSPLKANGTEDYALSKLLEHFKRLLKLKNNQLLYDVFVSFVTETLEQSTDSNQLIIFFMKLLSFGNLALSDILALIDDMSNQHNSKCLSKVSCELVFNRSLARASLSNTQYILFQIHQTDFQEKHKESIFCMFIQNAKANGLKDYAHLDIGLKVTMQLMASNKKLAFSFLTQDCPSLLCLYLCNRMLKQDGALVGEAEVSDIKDLAGVLKNGELLSEFSLPIYQLLLKTLTLEKKPTTSELTSVSIGFIEHLHFSFDPYNSFFGELFNYLEWESKEKVFAIFEDFYLTEKPGTSCSTGFVGHSGNNRVLPMLKDFFEKISMSQAENLKALLTIFRQLSQVLQALLKCVEQPSSASFDESSVAESLSIFLRLLIIHNSSLSDIMYKYDSTHLQFLQNLVKLYESDYFAKKDEKLRILLYDLLLLFKNSLSQLSTTNQKEVLLEETSPRTGSEDENPADVPGAGRNLLEVPSGNVEGLSGRNFAAMVGSMLNVPEPTSSTFNQRSEEFECSITLDEEELYWSSEISHVNNGTLVISEREKETTSVRIVPSNKHRRPFTINNMKLIEDTSENLNDGCVSLSLFEAYTIKENPY